MPDRRSSRAQGARTKRRAESNRGDQVRAKATVETHSPMSSPATPRSTRSARPGLAGLTFSSPSAPRSKRASPIGLDIARDELAFFPLIYWPVVPNAAKPSPAALVAHRRLHEAGRHRAVRHPRRDHGPARPRRREPQRRASLALRSILASLDIPELEPVPRDHVLTKTFYPAARLPGPLQHRAALGRGDAGRQGRDDESKRPARGGDGVSSILITSNDLAGAWATRPDGQADAPDGACRAAPA